MFGGTLGVGVHFLVSKDVTCEKTEGKLLAIGSMRTGEAKFSVYKHIILNHLGVGKGADTSRVRIPSKRKAEGKELTIGNIGMGKGKVLATGSMAHHEGNMQTETRELAPSSSLALSSGTQWSMQTETRELAPMSSISTLLALSDGTQGSMQTDTSGGIQARS